MLYEFGVSIALTLLLAIIANRYAPKNPNRDKATPFTGGEILRQEKFSYSYKKLLRYLLAFLAINMFIFAVSLSYLSLFWAAACLAIILLGLMLV